MSAKRLTFRAGVQEFRLASSKIADPQEEVVKFEATELRLLRASVSTLLDLVLLSTRAVERFPALPG